MKILSIIVPVYNVEKYIRTCIESIFNQGLDDSEFEVIIINDGTQDNSMLRISDIIENNNNIIVINQHNQGLSISRNKGLDLATGEYIAFFDSDDLLVHNSLKHVLDLTKHQQYDLIVNDFVSLDDDSIRNFSEEHETTMNFHGQVKNGKSLFLDDLNPRKCGVWRTIYRKDFLIKNNIRFIPGIYFEDIPFTHECYLKASLCIKTNILMYIYRKGHISITKGLTKQKGMDFGTALALTWKLALTKETPHQIREKIREDVFISFSVLMYSITEEIKDFHVKVQIVKHIREEAPDLVFTHGFKQLFISFMFKQMPNAYVLFKNIYQKIAKKIIY